MSRSSARTTARCTRSMPSIPSAAQASFRGGWWAARVTSRSSRRRCTSSGSAFAPALPRRPVGAGAGLCGGRRRRRRRHRASQLVACVAGIAAAPLGGIEAAPLAGYTVGVTAARRSEELTALLERRGARVVNAPAIRIVPLADDAELLAATSACVSRPPDVVVVTTGIGFRGWMEAADGWGLGEPLRAALATGQVVARGPKARGAIRASGLREDWSPESESMSEVLQHLLAAGVATRRIAVQLHGEPLSEFRETLAAAGA